MTSKKRAQKNEMMKLNFNEMALIKGGKEKPKTPDKPKTPTELISQPFTRWG